MTLQIDIPGDRTLRLEHLLLDQNGTLSDRGELIDGVADRLTTIRNVLSVHILTADTFGTLDEVTASLGVEGHRVSTGEEKRVFMDRLGAQTCVAIGNGRNDVPMLTGAALGLAVLGPEGTANAAATAADILCRSILVALDLLIEPKLLIATLRH